MALRISIAAGDQKSPFLIDTYSLVDRVYEGSMFPDRVYEESVLPDRVNERRVFPDRASLASKEIDPLIRYLGGTKGVGLKEFAVDNLRDILKDWHSEPLLTVSSLLENNGDALEVLQTEFNKSGLYSDDLSAMHLYDNCLILTSSHEPDCERIAVESIELTKAQGVEDMLGVKVTPSQLELELKGVNLTVHLNRDSSEYKVLGVHQHLPWHPTPQSEFIDRSSTRNSSLFHYTTRMAEVPKDSRTHLDAEWAVRPLPTSDTPLKSAYSTFWGREIKHMDFLVDPKKNGESSGSKGLKDIWEMGMGENNRIKLPEILIRVIEENNRRTWYSGHGYKYKL